MQTILISTNTMALIAGSTEDLTDRMFLFIYTELGDKNPSNFYFVPDYMLRDLSERVSWSIFPQSHLDENYTYDPNKIDTEFVDITPKTESRIPA